MKHSEEFKSTMKKFIADMLTAGPDHAGRDEIAAAAADLSADILTGDFSTCREIIADMLKAAETITETEDALDMFQRLESLQKMYRREDTAQQLLKRIRSARRWLAHAVSDHDDNAAAMAERELIRMKETLES